MSRFDDTLAAHRGASAVRSDTSPADRQAGPGLSRRGFLIGTLGASAVLAFGLPGMAFGAADAASGIVAPSSAALSRVWKRPNTASPMVTAPMRRLA